MGYDIFYYLLFYYSTVFILSTILSTSDLFSSSSAISTAWVTLSVMIPISRRIRTAAPAKAEYSTESSMKDAINVGILAFLRKTNLYLFNSFKYELHSEEAACDVVSVVFERHLYVALGLEAAIDRLPCEIICSILSNGLACSVSFNLQCSVFVEVFRFVC